MGEKCRNRKFLRENKGCLEKPSDVQQGTARMVKCHSIDLHLQHVLGDFGRFVSGKKACVFEDDLAIFPARKICLHSPRGNSCLKIPLSFSRIRFRKPTWVSRTVARM